MKWLVTPFLVVTAFVLALLVLRRWRRGQTVVLTGRWSPRLVRLVAIVLVLFGFGTTATPQETKGAPNQRPTPEGNDPLPTTLTTIAITDWLHHQTPGSYANTAKLAHAKVMAAPKPTADEITAAETHLRYLPEGLATLLRADWRALKEGQPLPSPTVAQLHAALTECTASHYYDHYWTAYLWRKALSANLTVADEPAWSTIFANLRQNARLTDLLLRTQATVKPVMASQRAWMSKAGPGPQERQLMAEFQKAVGDMRKLASEQFATTDEGTWKRDGVIMLKADSTAPAPILIRAGQKKDFSTEFATRLGRLDLLKTAEQPCVLRHDRLGAIELPAKTLLSIGQLPKYLPAPATHKLDQLVQEALTKNSEEAADRLETMLPLAHEAMRRGLKELPQAKGAPRLRLILALFDDALMPALQPTPTRDDGTKLLPGGASPGRPPGERK
jgi:hypothetical protein